MLLGDLVGLVWGVASGYIGRRFDLLSQRLLEVVLAFPGLILATMLLLVAGGRASTTVIIAIAVTRVPSSTRVIRSVALATKEMVYVEAARVAGASSLADHVPPHRAGLHRAVPGDLQRLARDRDHDRGGAQLRGRRGAAAGPELGHDARRRGGGQVQPALVAGRVPGLAITITVLAINLAGDSLRDFLDPQLRRRVD